MLDYTQQLLDWSKRSKFSLYLRLFISNKKEQKLVIPATGASSPEFPKICLISNEEGTVLRRPTARGISHLLQTRGGAGEGGQAVAGKEGNPVYGRHRWDPKPRSQNGSPSKGSGPREALRGGTPGWARVPRAPPRLFRRRQGPGTADRGSGG